MNCACGQPLKQREGKPPGRRVIYCATCREQRDREQARRRGERYRQRQGRAQVRKLKVATPMLLRQVTAAVGESDTRRTHQIERQAINKIRKHPEFGAVLRLWREWVAAGKPRPLRPHVGDLMLQHQEQLADFYEIHERVAAVDAAAGQEILAEIERYQQALARGLEQLKRT